MKDLLPWIMSCITIYCIWRQGDKWKWVWLLTLANQALWFTWIFLSKSYGLLPMTIVITFLSVRNHLKWSK